jgi:hypothetical protein
MGIFGGTPKMMGVRIGDPRSCRDVHLGKAMIESLPRAEEAEVKSAFHKNTIARCR